jgi:MATE family multidrug resistance protein
MAPPSAPTGNPTTAFANDVASQIEGLVQAQDVAEEAISRDLEQDNSASEDDDSSSGSDTATQFSMINSYRRPSWVNPGSRSTAIISSSVPERSHASTSWKKHSHLSKKERELVRNEEKSLLRDNDLLPPKHPRHGSEGPFDRIRSEMPILGLRRVKSTPDEESAIESSSERTALLGASAGSSAQPYGGLDSPKNYQ